MFDCTTCNQNADEMAMGPERLFFGLVTRRNVIYRRRLHDECEECGDGPGEKFMVYTDHYPTLIGP